MLTVTIEFQGIGAFGGVTETLPPLFTYVPNSSTVDEPTITGQAVTGQELFFVLFGVGDSFSYEVTVPTVEQDYDFPRGEIKDSQSDVHHIDRESTVTVGTATAAGPSPGTGVTPPAQRGATRTLSKTTVDQGEEFTVTIAATYGSFGSVMETVPKGFTYRGTTSGPGMSSPLPASQVSGTGRTRTFTLFGEESFSYTVEASRAGDPTSSPRVPWLTTTGRHTPSEIPG